MAYIDAGAGEYPTSPLHSVLVNKELGRSLWGTDELPGEPELERFHAQIADALARAEGFPHEPAVLTLPAHRSGKDVRCELRYKPLGHVAGLCLDFAG
ncbi:hypothetical protein DPQ33_12005 [Oceanidesulfovibrio indonesiensis]|uniref:Uncharacterized protein n=1 Tax=Oceanidesulfovibrio indonesiensis TaxID=54767 RepID=A0A7M3MCV2_9BACT|nr:hypothetical protein [Oceanidesulfovibrio indonesiensis]TVM16344.1 hypothetical protein DPQ33_12005 [Oceanidesulfovibrio indonesiensis]